MQPVFAPSFTTVAVLAAVTIIVVPTIVIIAVIIAVILIVRLHPHVHEEGVRLIPHQAPAQEELPEAPDVHQRLHDRIDEARVAQVVEAAAAGKQRCAATTATCWGCSNGSGDELSELPSSTAAGRRRRCSLCFSSGRLCSGSGVGAGGVHNLYARVVAVAVCGIALHSLHRRSCVWRLNSWCRQRGRSKRCPS